MMLSCRVSTISLKVLGCSHLDASPPPAEGLGANVGGDEVAVAHSPRPAEEVCQAMSHTGSCVAGSLLCCNAVSFSCLLLQLLCRHLHKLLDDGVE